MKTKYTVSDIMKLKPCSIYDRDKVKALWKGKRYLSLSEIFKLRIPVDDKMWVLIRLAPTSILAEWGEYCVNINKRAAKRSGYPHYYHQSKRSLQVINGELLTLGFLIDKRTIVFNSVAIARYSSLTVKNTRKKMNRILKKLIEMMEEHE